MFIKIKLEPQNSKDLSPPKKISYLSIDDDAAIIDLKMKVERLVDVPVERQELRTLEKVFENSNYVREVCDIRGTAIMLYAYDEHHELRDPQFVCFIQIYTNELAAEQQEHEQRSRLPTNTKTSDSSTSSITLIASSGTDTDSEDTCSETSSGSDVGSDISTENTESSLCKKRFKLGKNCILRNKKLKVTASSTTQFPKPLCQFLDEFPKSIKEISSSKDGTQTGTYKTSDVNLDTNTIAKCAYALGKHSEIEELNYSNSISMEKRKTSDTEFKNTDLAKIQSSNITTTISKMDQNSLHPCHFISPEIRDYLAIILPNDGEAIGKHEIENLLAWFFDRFHAYGSSSNLQFDNKTAISVFDGKLWIACANSKTYDWISASIAEYSAKQFKILPLNDFGQTCEVVVPIVSNTKNILDIFDLLQKQNQNITTLKWSVKSRQALSVENKDFNEKAVSRLCINELLSISIDVESKNILEKLDFKLKYCFWQIIFKFT